jgi:hypothetical protein
MANWLTQAEVDGLRADFAELLGSNPTASPRVDDQPHTTVSITRSNGDGVLNVDSGKLEGETFATVYSGEAYGSPVVFRRDRQETAGGEAFRFRQYRVLIPWDGGDVWVDDIFTWVTCLDPNVAGRVMTVIDVLYESELAARRLTLVDLTQDGAGAC